MAPTPKYTKEEIINAAIEFVRENGYDMLTARDLAKALNTSTRPIFTAFENMDELKREIIYKAAAIFEDYKAKEIKSNKYTEYKASGMSYIRFAKEEKNLFKLLFMRDRTNEKGVEELSISSEVNFISKYLSLSEKEATEFHIKMWVVMHGFATMITTDYLNLDYETISKLTTEIFNAIKDGATNWTTL